MQFVLLLSLRRLVRTPLYTTTSHLSVCKIAKKLQVIWIWIQEYLQVFFTVARCCKIHFMKICLFYLFIFPCYSFKSSFFQLRTISRLKYFLKSCFFFKPWIVLNMYMLYPYNVKINKTCFPLSIAHLT